MYGEPEEMTGCAPFPSAVELSVFPVSVDEVEFFQWNYAFFFFSLHMLLNVC